MKNITRWMEDQQASWRYEMYRGIEGEQRYTEEKETEVSELGFDPDRYTPEYLIKINFITNRTKNAISSRVAPRIAAMKDMVKALKKFIGLK